MQGLEQKSVCDGTIPRPLNWVPYLIGEGANPNHVSSLTQERAFTTRTRV